MSGNYKDLTGVRHNHLTGIRVTRKGGNKEYWLFKCDCGEEIEVLKRYVLYNDVTRCRKCAGRIGDITGKKWGKLTAVSVVKGNHWLFKCDCGNTQEFPASAVMREHTVQCHECKLKMLKRNSTKHNKTDTRLHRIWRAMKSRCNNKNYWAYKWYGAKGVSVCDEWKDDFMTFYNWAMSNGYSENLTIDRISCDGNYEPNNCRWISQSEQMQNMSNRVYVTFNGESKTLIGWARFFGIKPWLIYKRYERGLRSPEELFNGYISNNSST